MIEIVMLSDCRDAQKETMTRQAIFSLNHCGSPVKIILVDSSGRTDLDFKNTQIISVPGQFNYNRNLRIGLEYLSGEEYVMISNNDIYARKGFALKLIEGLKTFDTVCPRSPRWVYHKDFRTGVYPGWRTSYEFCGWAIMMRQSLLQELTPAQCFPLELWYWFQDDYFSEVLQKYGKKHALIGTALLDHLQGKSFDILKSQGKLNAATWELKPIFEELKAKLHEQTE